MTEVHICHCGQRLKGYKKTRTIRGRKQTYIEYNHENPSYEHITPFNTFKCYNKKKPT